MTRIRTAPAALTMLASAVAASALTVLGVAAGTASAAPARQHAVEIRPPANAGANPGGFLVAASCAQAGSCVAGA